MKKRPKNNTIIGSLYFAADAFPGCTVAKVTGATTSELNNHVESNFVIDPVAEQAFNEDGPHPDEIDCGPCESLKRIATEIRIDQLTLAPPSAQGSILKNIS